MSIPAPPDVRDLPTTPSRANAADGDVFSSLMDNHLAALPLWSGDLEALGQWTFARATDIAQAVQQVQNIETNVSTLGDQKIQAASQQADRARAEADRAQGVSDSVAAQANFRGLWGGLAGAVAPPLSVYHQGNYWQLLAPLADVASVEPGTDAGTWLTMAQTSLEIGQIAYSFDDLTASGLFVEPGMSYLQSAYPELFGVVGVGEGAYEIEAPWPTSQPTGIAKDVGVTLASGSTDEFVIIGMSDQTTPVMAFARNGSDLSAVTTDQPTLGSSPTYIHAEGLTEDSFAVYIGFSGYSKIHVYSYSQALSKFEIVYEVDVVGYVYGLRYHEGTSRLLAFGSDPQIAIYEFNSGSGSLTDLSVALSPARVSGVDSAAWLSDGSGIYTTEPYSSWWTLASYTLSGTTLTRSALVTDDAVFFSSAQATDIRVSESGDYVAIGCRNSTNGNLKILRVDGGAFTSLLSKNFGPGSVLRAVLMDTGGRYFYGYSKGSRRWKLYKRDDPTTVSEVPVTATLEVFAVAAAKDGRYAYCVTGAAPYLHVIEPEFPFDAETEFYVPDVTSLTPTTIGTWAPSALGKPYVRAK